MAVQDVIATGQYDYTVVKVLRLAVAIHDGTAHDLAADPETDAMYRYLQSYEADLLAVARACAERIGALAADHQEFVAHIPRQGKDETALQFQARVVEAWVASERAAEQLATIESNRANRIPSPPSPTPEPTTATTGRPRRRYPATPPAETFVMAGGVWNRSDFIGLHVVVYRDELIKRDRSKFSADQQVVKITGIGPKAVKVDIDSAGSYAFVPRGRDEVLQRAQAQHPSIQPVGVANQ